MIPGGQFFLAGGQQEGSRCPVSVSVIGIPKLFGTLWDKEFRKNKVLLVSVVLHGKLPIGEAGKLPVGDGTSRLGGEGVHLQVKKLRL